MIGCRSEPHPGPPQPGSGDTVLGVLLIAVGSELPKNVLSRAAGPPTLTVLASGGLGAEKQTAITRRLADWRRWIIAIPNGIPAATDITLRAANEEVPGVADTRVPNYVGLRQGLPWAPLMGAFRPGIGVGGT